MKLKAMAISSLFLAACGSMENEKPIAQNPTPKKKEQIGTQQRMLDHLFKNVKVEKELYPNVVEFITMCSLVGGEFTSQCERRLLALQSVEMVDSFENSPNVVGTCSYGVLVSSPRNVKVLRGFLDFNSLSMKGLVFHELGHCLLGQDHDYSKELDIMAPYLLSEADYGDYWKVLVKKLFNPIRLPKEKYSFNFYQHEDTFEDIGHGN